MPKLKSNLWDRSSGLASEDLILLRWLQLDMKAPETKKQVRQVMGMFSYFRDFIPNFAELAKPLACRLDRKTSTKSCAMEK